MLQNLITAFEQARINLRTAENRLKVDRQTYNSYRRQVRAAGLSEAEQQQYCASALESVRRGIAAEQQAKTVAQAAYDAIPVSDRPIIDYL